MSWLKRKSSDTAPLQPLKRLFPSALVSEPTESAEAAPVAPRNGSATTPPARSSVTKTAVVEERLKVVLTSDVVSLRGERADMQDAHVCFDNFKLGDEDASLYLLCDGHAGIRAANFVTEQLPEYIKSHWKGEATAKRTLVDGFKLMDEQFLEKAKSERPPWKDGCTVALVLRISSRLYLASVGDSRAVLYRTNSDDSTGSMKAQPLTQDHTPESWAERQRIQKAGGVVKDGRVNGTLEVARSIGDYWFKKHGPLVSCVPDVRRCQLAETDHTLIVACDGLWKVLSNEQVAVELAKEDAPDLTAHLTRLAVRQMSGDNVTVIRVLLNVTPRLVTPS